MSWRLTRCINGRNRGIVQLLLGLFEWELLETGASVEVQSCAESRENWVCLF